MKELRGIIPILLTPFDDNMEVDEEVLLCEVNYCIEQGIHGLGVNGMASECYKLTCEESMRITELVMKEVRGRVPVVVGFHADGTFTSVLLARHANKMGAAAVFGSAPAPPHNGPTEDTIYTHFKKLNDAVDIPIIVHDHLVPVSSGLIKRMADEFEHVRYVKEWTTMNTGQKITSILNHTDKVKVFGIGLNMLDELQRGAIGQMTSCMCLTQYVKIFESFMQGDTETAWTEWLRLMPLITFRKQINAILLSKEYLRQNGVFKNINTREPAGVSLDEMEIKFMNQLMIHLELSA